MSDKYREGIIELGVVIIGAFIVYVVSGWFDVLEGLLDFLLQYEEYELDEFLVVLAYLAIALFILVLRRLIILRSMTLELQQKNVELENAAQQIKTLKGVIPICMHCKKIRDSEDRWVKLEAYICSRTESRFSHGVCPECIDIHYKEFAEE